MYNMLMSCVCVVCLCAASVCCVSCTCVCCRCMCRWLYIWCIFASLCVVCGMYVCCVFMCVLPVVLGVEFRVLHMLANGLHLSYILNPYNLSIRNLSQKELRIQNGESIVFHFVVEEEILHRTSKALVSFFKKNRSIKLDF